MRREEEKRGREEKRREESRREERRETQEKDKRRKKGEERGDEDDDEKMREDERQREDEATPPTPKAQPRGRLALQNPLHPAVLSADHPRYAPQAPHMEIQKKKVFDLCEEYIDKFMTRASKIGFHP